MIYPIVAYGDPVLRKVAQNIPGDSPEVQTLIANMFETMYKAHGVGLAAPQIGQAVRLFIVDAEATEEPGTKGFKKVFINAHIVEETGKEWSYEEGCLSIPGIRSMVSRKPDILIEYQDEHFVNHRERFTGMVARIIQHEYDHIEGILFTDHLAPLKKRLLKAKLSNISKGIVDADYRMRFPLGK